MLRMEIALFLIMATVPRLLNDAVYRPGVGAVRLRRLPGIYQGVQEIRGHHPLPVPAGFSVLLKRNTIPCKIRRDLPMGAGNMQAGKDQQ